MAQFWSMNSARLPQRGVVGDVYMATETRDLFIAVADGRLIPLAGLLNPVTVEGARGAKGDTGVAGGIGLPGLQGPPGRDGVDGKSVSGPKGPRGATGAQGVPGRDGIDGKDGATGATGPQGPQGPKGEVTVIGDAELAAAVEKLRQELIQHRAKLAHALNDAKLANQTMPRSANRTHREQVVSQIERLAT
jgi:hypothetical protein